MFIVYPSIYRIVYRNLLLSDYNEMSHIHAI